MSTNFASPSYRAASSDLTVAISPLGLVELADEEFEVHGPRLNRYAQVVVTFKNPLPAGVTPFVHTQEINTATKSLGLIPTGISNTGFTLTATTAPTASQAGGTFLCEYHVES